MLMRFSKTPVQSSISRMMDEFFNGGLMDMNDRSLMATQPSVNIVENEDSFTVEVAAPGLDKDDFNVVVEDDVLTISGEKKHETEEKGEKNGTFTRREFNYTAFSRSFHLPDSCQSDDIMGSYNNGVLILSIPKREEAKKKPAKTIEIS